MHRAILFALLLLPASARPGEVPVRNGFTLELSIGLGAMHIFPEQGDATNDVGMAPLSLSLGGFLSKIVSFLLFYGAHFQYWITDQFFVSGGPGIAVLGSAEWGDFVDTLDRKRGFGLGLRGGFSFANWENHSLRVTLELFPSFFKNGTAMGEAINFEWQWF